MEKSINIADKHQLFHEYWTPKIVGEANGCHVKLFKAKGEFVWHQHKDEDEFFLVTKGVLHIKLPDSEVTLHPGEFFIVPKGVDHLPYADEEAHVLLFEPKQVVNTGEKETACDKTVDKPEWI